MLLHKEKHKTKVMCQRKKPKLSSSSYISSDGSWEGEFACRLAISLAYTSGKEGGILLVQMISTCLPPFYKWKGSHSHCKDTIPKIRNKFPQKRNCAASVPISTFMRLWAIYIFPGSVCLFCCRKIRGPILGIYKSLIDTWMWKLWLRPRNSQNRNT